MMDPLRIAELFEHKQARAAVDIAKFSEPLADGFMSCDVPESYLNRACGFGFKQDLGLAEVDRLIAFFGAHGCEPNVELASFAPQGLLDALATRRFVLRHFENVLVAPIDEVAVPRIEGVRIARVDVNDEAMVREYARVAGSGFLPAGAEMSEDMVATGVGFARLPISDAYAAWSGDRMVAAAGMESSLGTSSLFGTTVVPEFRRRGIQRALILARMARGKERGSHTATICSKPGIPTERNAARVGFSFIYTRVVLALPSA